MENEKIDEIGEKLGVNSSKIVQKKSQNWFKKYSFWIINGISFILSSLMGIIFGMSEHKYRIIYPFFTENAKNGILAVYLVNLTNGVFIIRQKKKSVILRTLIFYINLILSIIGYGLLYSLIASSDQLTRSITYNVYDPLEIKQ